MTIAIHDFPSASALSPAGPNEFDGFVPDEWQQGRGAFGGLGLGLLARAMTLAVDDPSRALRSLTGALPGPLQPGAVRVVVEVIRQGSGVSTLTARIVQQRETLAIATGVFGRARTTDRTWSPAPPVIPAYETARVAAIEPPLGPAFARFYEFRPTGPLPFTGHSEPIAAGWIKTRAPLATIGAPEIVAYADAWWPGLYAIETAPRPIATLGFTLQIHADLATLDPRAPLFHRAHTVSASEGFSIEHRELWTAQGALVAMNQQTFAIIR